MTDNTLNILRPSVNNLTVRIFVRAAGLDFEEVDVWGKKGTPEFLAKDPADLTPLLEEEGLQKGSLWESCAIMQYLCNKHGLERFYPADPAARAMVAARAPTVAASTASCVTTAPVGCAPLPTEWAATASAAVSSPAAVPRRRAAGLAMDTSVRPGPAGPSSRHRCRRAVRQSRRARRGGATSACSQRP